MSDNQTIDGVSRKSLEQALKLAAVFDDGGDGAGAESARGVVWILRALLDAPACNECEDVGYHVTMGAQRSCWACKPAAQTQGEEFSAVGWSIDHTAGRPILAHNNCSVIEAEQAYGVLELIRKSAQPQGEPVARVEIGADRDAVMTITDDNWLRSLKARGIHQIVPLYAEQPAPFQARVKPWLLECFGEAIAADRQERNHRFLEEALELVQANQCTASEAHQLVDYVYGRPVGEPSQEVGGVMVTLAALCLATEIDMHAAGETELGRIWTKVDQIRAKQAAKPAMSPLPGVYPDREQPAPVAVASRDESIYWLKRIDGIGQARAELIYSMGFRRHTEVPQS